MKSREEIKKIYEKWVFLPVLTGAALLNLMKHPILIITKKHPEKGRKLGVYWRLFTQKGTIAVLV